MTKTILGSIAMAGLVCACGSSYPPPTQPMADAQAADRSARELGAAGIPTASLHLKLAEEQRTKAAALMEDGDNERATALLVRAKADAELAVALAREAKAKADVEEAKGKVHTENGPRVNAPAPSTTTTTTNPGAAK